MVIRYIHEGALEDEKRRTRPVESVYVVLAPNPHGGEDIVGIRGPEGWMPLVITGDGPVDVIRRTAARLAAVSRGPGPWRLVRFNSREVLEEFPRR